MLEEWAAADAFVARKAAGGILILEQAVDAETNPLRREKFWVAAVRLLSV